MSTTNTNQATSSSTGQSTTTTNTNNNTPSGLSLLFHPKPPPPKPKPKSTEPILIRNSKSLPEVHLSAALRLAGPDKKADEAERQLRRWASGLPEKTSYLSEEMWRGRSGG